MAKLVDVMKENQILNRRQLPLVIDENLTMVLDLSGLNLVCDNASVRGRQLEEFMKKYTVLDLEEVTQAFQVTYKHCLDILNQTIPCIGCRKSVERVFTDLSQSGYPALSPLVITPDGILTIQQDYLKWPNHLCSLLHGHSTKLNNLASSWPGRAKATRAARRCPLHSLDSARYLTRPLSYASGWRDAWDCMRNACKEQVVLIESCVLLATLETYLRKHRFCGECRTKVMRAYTLLVEEKDPSKEKGFVSSLYAGIRRCLADKHIHLELRTEFIASLIARAEPELIGNRRERHAKTLEIAQEEVLTCIGICVYERLHKIQLKLREEQCTYQVLATVAIEALCRNFETVVEEKQGVSQLELCYLGMIRDDQVKQQRRELKKLKKRKRREERKQQLMKQLMEKETFECENCAELYTEDEEHSCAPPPPPHRGSNAQNSPAAKTTKKKSSRKTPKDSKEIACGVTSTSENNNVGDKKASYTEDEEHSCAPPPPPHRGSNAQNSPAAKTPKKKSSRKTPKDSKEIACGVTSTSENNNVGDKKATPGKSKLKRKAYEKKTESVDTDENCVCEECCKETSSLKAKKLLSTQNQTNPNKSGQKSSTPSLPSTVARTNGTNDTELSKKKEKSQPEKKNKVKKSKSSGGTNGRPNAALQSTHSAGNVIGMNAFRNHSNGQDLGSHSNGRDAFRSHSNGRDAFRNHSNGQDLGSHSNGRERDAFGSHSNGRDAFGSQSNQNASLGTECFHSNGSDGGYTSGHTSALSSPASSEVACSDGFCNHEGSEDCSTRNEPPTNLSPLNLFNSNLSLEQMLHGSWSGCPGDRDRGSCDDLEDDGECCIPLEEVEKFRARIQNVEEKRQRLRQTLVQRFQSMVDKSRCPI
ncbi:gametogenetin-binding protein 2-like [Diaphorina citri]|uniref:Gametogenetin-binding protein 2-like n=2 Tax=Diaphorina citri TaxID=121845 RepID=A0A3Q0IT11_DIACI|nr:gametogenetin-binding protein 2-like [Diaphorina citri]